MLGPIGLPRGRDLADACELMLSFSYGKTAHIVSVASMLRERVECKILHVALTSAPRFIAGVGNHLNARACISAQIHTKVLVKRGDTAQGIADQRLELDVEDRIRLIVFAVARLDEYRRALRTVFAYLTADLHAVNVAREGAA